MHILAHRRQQQRSRSRTHPPPARTQDNHAGSLLLRTQRHMRRSRRPRPSQHRSTHTAPFFLHKSSHAAPTALGPLGFASRAQRTAPFSCSAPPPFFWPAVFSSLLAAPTRSVLRHARIQARTHTRARTIATRSALRHACTHARTHARARTTDDERRDVRSAGVADRKTARGMIAERTLTAAPGPSPCDPYRHALARRPSPKARPFVS